MKIPGINNTKQFFFSNGLKMNYSTFILLKVYINSVIANNANANLLYKNQSKNTVLKKIDMVLRTVGMLPGLESAAAPKDEKTCLSKSIFIY